MLEFIRKYAQGIVATVIFGMLIVAFALWGIQSYFGQSGADDSAATVNGEKISQLRLQTAMRFYQARLQAMLGKNYDPSMFTPKLIRDNAMQSLVDQEVLYQAATKAGYRVSDAELAAAIRGQQQFQKDGVFNEDLYQRLLRSQGLSPGMYEEDLRRSMVIQQMQDGVASSAVVTDAELKRLVQIRDQQRDFGYLTITPDRYMKDIKIDAAAVKARYDRDGSQYIVPEQVSVSYLDLSVDDLAKDVKATDADLHKYYNDHIANFGTEETRRASHILITVPQGADEKAVAKAKAKAEDVLKQVNAGKKSFADLAKEYSQDPGSAKQGGDLGYFGHGVMDPAFEKAVFGLKPGQVSGLVRSSFGFHIIKLDDIKPGKVKSFDQVRAQIDGDYRREQARNRYYDMKEKLENLTYEHPDTLEEAAKALNLPIKTTGFFSRDDAEGNALASNDDVRKAAFDDDVLNNNYNSLPVEISADRTVVLRKKDFKPSSARPLDDVGDAIRAQLKRERASEEAQQDGDKAVKRLAAGDDPQAVAKDLGAKWVRMGYVGRNDSKAKLDPTLLQDVFKLAPPADGAKKPTVGGAALNQGGYAVYAVYAIKPGDFASLKPEDVKSLRSSVASSAGQTAYRLLLEDLKSKATIKIKQDT